jgi:hypothetical protein
LVLIGSVLVRAIGATAMLVLLLVRRYGRSLAVAMVPVVVAAAMLCFAVDWNVAFARFWFTTHRAEFVAAAELAESGAPGTPGGWDYYGVELPPGLRLISVTVRMAPTALDSSRQLDGSVLLVPRVMAPLVKWPSTAETAPATGLRSTSMSRRAPGVQLGTISAARAPVLRPRAPSTRRMGRHGARERTPGARHGLHVLGETGLLAAGRAHRAGPRPPAMRAPHERGAASRPTDRHGLGALSATCLVIAAGLDRHRHA